MDEQHVFLRASDEGGSQLSLRLDGELTPDHRARIAAVLTAVDGWERVWFEIAATCPLVAEAGLEE